jgi:hypothetical protein
MRAIFEAYQPISAFSGLRKDSRIITCRPAAVHRQHSAGHVAGLVRRQIERGLGDFTWLADPARKVLLICPLMQFRTGSGESAS